MLCARMPLRLQHSVDRLFHDQPLGFAHFDVEGEELNVLRGAVHVIRRDRPVFTVELHVHQSHSETQALLSFIAHLGYSSFMVESDGPCGLRFDCRNLICVPHERSEALRSVRRHLHSYDVLPVNASTIIEFAHPCCKPYGACCPDGPVPMSEAWTAQNHGISCCTPKVMHAYYQNKGASHRYSAPAIATALGIVPPIAMRPRPP